MIYSLSNQEKRANAIQALFNSVIEYSDELAEAREYDEAEDVLYSAAEYLEELNVVKAFELNKRNISLMERQIKEYKIQAKLHEVAELYLRVADLYEKMDNLHATKENISNSIRYLEEESNLLKEFNETRKLAQNYQNIAELYLRINNIENSIIYYQNVIDLSKICKFFDLLSFSYQQISSCYEDIDDYKSYKIIITDGIDYFTDLYTRLEEKNDNLGVAQMCQILKNLYNLISNQDQFEIYSKREAGAYINLAETLDKTEENYSKIGRYYRGAGLCYQELTNNLIESASCFVLAGNYMEKNKDFSEAALNFLDAGNVFKELKNFEMAYKNLIKSGDNFWKFGDVNQSTENFMMAYDIAIEGNLEFNRFGIFNQIVRGLNKIAEEGLKNQEFFTAATLILESIKFYEKLDIAEDVILQGMVRNVYKYYYKAANLRKIGHSHIIHSYVLAALSCILKGDLSMALEIITEIDSEGKTISEYKKIIEFIIESVSQGKTITLENFPFKLRRLIEGSEEMTYLINLFERIRYW